MNRTFKTVNYVLPTDYFNAETLVVIISAYFAFGYKRSSKAFNRNLDEKPTLKVCIDDDFDFARVIGAAQRAEHYEIAAYGTVKRFAGTLGHFKHVSLLEQTLEEEKETDEH